MGKLKRSLITASITVVCFLMGCGSSATTKAIATEEMTEALEPEQKEPEITDVSDTEKTVFFYRDDMKIFGKMYFPEGEGTFPTVILMTGFGGSYTTVEDIATKLANNGIAGVVFNPIGAVAPSKSDGLLTEMSVLTEASDLNTVLDGISSMPKIDKDNIFLWGHSFGGLVTTYEATQIPDKIKGLVLVEPSYQMPDEFKKLYPEGTEIPDVIQQPIYAGKIFVEDMISFDIYDLVSNYDRNVLIFQGTVAPSIGAEAPEIIDKAANTFPQAKVVAVEEANHVFSGEARKRMIEQTIDFINENVD